MNVYDNILTAAFMGRKMLAVLLDPEKMLTASLPLLAEELHKGNIDFVFVGGSGCQIDLSSFVIDLKQYLPDIPIVLFPGDIAQFTPQADALLFLSVLSGRNPDMLIGQQVRVAQQVYQSGIETIPMGYILVSGGKQSAVERASHTTAIPQDNLQEVLSTALAGQLLGMQLIYLEAGSGALTPVAPQLIQAVKQTLSLPLIVGGGICTVEQMQAAYHAGADLVVIGNHFEARPEEISLFGKAR